MGNIHPKQLICKVCIFVVFLERSIYIDVLFVVYVKKYTCMYHEIGRRDDDMYVKRYVGMLRISIYEVQKTFSIVHIFAFAKSSKFYQMTSFCISYC